MDMHNAGKDPQQPGSSGPENDDAMLLNPSDTHISEADPLRSREFRTDTSNSIPCEMTSSIAGGAGDWSAPPDAHFDWILGSAPLAGGACPFQVDWASFLRLEAHF